MSPAQTTITLPTQPNEGGATKPGSPTGAADLLSALERSDVGRARVAEVAALIDMASELEDALRANGGAGLGSVVTVADRVGRISTYELIERPERADAPLKVTPGSPVAKALVGARAGDYVRFVEPNGRHRRVRVVDVTPPRYGPGDAERGGRAAT
jgi:transcription elongation GreA/GreB family factor